MKQILFSCIGTTDPVRGEHDGPLLHILRHYRPEVAYLFLTPEIRALVSRDDRLEKTRLFVRERWGGYAPSFHCIESDVKNAHDIDALDLPLREAMTRISREHPDAEILINVSSGTPQMQMILSQLAMDTRYRARGIQVSNFERSSGKTQRTNQKDYDIELELECNEDELPEAENRCVEPEMYAIRREFLRRQITVLLDRRNFEAVEQLRSSLPENLGNLAAHLAARSRLQKSEAAQLASAVRDLPFPLYAYKTGSRGAYNEVLEYYLLMKNLAKTGNCTEFLLHMEPLTLALQLALLDKLLQGSGNSTGDFIRAQGNRRAFFPVLLQAALPALYDHYTQRMAQRSWTVQEKEINTYLCDDLLSYFSELPARAAQLFAHYDMLKDLRNQLAHTLRAVSEEDVRAACQVGTGALLEEMEGTIMACYSACDPVIFSVYEKSIEYIKSNL